MEIRERPPAQPNPEARPEEAPHVSLIAAIGATALSAGFVANGVILAQEGWRFEGSSVIFSGLFALGTAILGAREWVKFHRNRDAGES